MNSLRIGQLAKLSGVGIETVRFYERRGLLAEPARRASGYRQYDPSTVARLQFIRRTKELGFQLKEIKELLSLWFDPGATCCEVRQKAKAKIVEIDERIASLKTMKKALARITNQCQERNLLADCPLFTGLESSASKASKTNRHVN